MRVSYQIDLKTIKTLRSDLEQRSKALFKTGEYVRGVILNNWNQGKGASGDTLKALSSEYRDRKTGDGVSVKGVKHKGQGLPDLMLTGDLQRGLVVEKKGNSKIEVTFVGDEQGKARGNELKRPTIMKVDSAFDSKIKNAFKRIIFKNITKG